MRAIRPLLIAVGCALLGAWLTPAASDDGVVLYHRFELPPGLAWGQVSVPLDPAAWRVGASDGPPADAALLRRALGRLAAVEIGGRCAGWVDGSTVYPCGFAVTDAHIDGGERFTANAIDWEAPAEARGRRLPGTDTPEFRASGLIAPVIDELRFVAVRAPQRLLGQRESALGGRIEFRMRALSNALVPSEFDRAGGGVVILRGGGAAGDVAAVGPRA